MSNILLDYFFPISAIEPTPAASTGFLKQACIVVKPKMAVPTGEITLCTSMSQVEALTDNTEAQQLFNAGMSRVFVLPMDDLQLASSLEGYESAFFTLLISSDFDQSDILDTEAADAVAATGKIQSLNYEAKAPGLAGNSISINYNSGGTAGSEGVAVAGSAITVTIEDGESTAAQVKSAIEGDSEANALVAITIDEGESATAQTAIAEAVSLTGGLDAVVAAEDGLSVGTWGGVVGLSHNDAGFLATQSVIPKRVAFKTTTATKAKNLFFAFGKMLSNALNWRNQQYIAMPFGDDVDTLGLANALFDDKISFVISDAEFGERLALLAVGGKAIVAPYIQRNLELDLQSRALSYISGNQPSYSKTQAALLEDELSKVIQSYIDREWIEDGVVEVKLEQDNFVASGYINIAEPKALWRIFGEMRQTL